MCRDREYNPGFLAIAVGIFFYSVININFRGCPCICVEIESV